MIDTIRMFFPHERRADVPDHWRLKTEIRKFVSADGQTGVVEKCVYYDKNTGLRAEGDEHEIKWIEVSLPRLLHGHNGKLIKSQAEIDKALWLLRRKLNEIGIRQSAECWFNRVDLVWQIRAEPGDFICAHKNCRHKKIRKEQGHYTGQSLYWKGSELLVRMYDKVLEMSKKPGSIVRVEAQLRGRTLKKQLSDGAGHVKHLNFEQCYQAYRNLMLGFCPAALPKASGLVDILAIAQQEGWESKGVSAFDIWARSKSTKQKRRVQRELAMRRIEIYKIDWSGLLPADRLPPAVEVEADDFMAGYR
jgi:hypothetical protein